MFGLQYMNSILLPHCNNIHVACTVTNSEEKAFVCEIIKETSIQRMPNLAKLSSVCI